jgi:hypothetical protein
MSTLGNNPYPKVRKVHPSIRRQSPQLIAPPLLYSILICTHLGTDTIHMDRYLPLPGVILMHSHTSKSNSKSTHTRGDDHHTHTSHTDHTPKMSAKKNKTREFKTHTLDKTHHATRHETPKRNTQRI